jgi:(1->4)-alpha-D-glucan 1-alpha-D-glucosylmutase
MRPGWLADLVEAPALTPRVPLATYRLQFHRGFTFDDARRLVPYLAALGISDVYASPYLTARPGSAHGYDVCDHGTLNPELGAPEAYAAFATALQARGMGQLLDVVPNHMGIAAGCNR